MGGDDTIPDMLLAQARAGDEAALGRLLELYRNYLRLMARSLVNQPLQARFDASDLVQETFLEAHREFGRFIGSSEPELVAWLRKILVHNLADQVKHHRRQRRDPRHEESLEKALDRSSLAVQRALAAPLSSPSARLQKRERTVLLADALEKLSTDYREVFILRSLEQVPVEQIAAQLGRSTNAVYKLWCRAVTALRQELKGLS
jgi:RNA polymerase sigma-70 factor (ECF subfamily)